MQSLLLRWTVSILSGCNKYLIYESALWVVLLRNKLHLAYITSNSLQMWFISIIPPKCAKNFILSVGTFTDSVLWNTESFTHLLQSECMILNNRFV